MSFTIESSDDTVHVQFDQWKPVAASIGNLKYSRRRLVSFRLVLFLDTPSDFELICQ